METLLMSAKERKRLVILAEVRKKRMSLAQAGRVMGMSYRQAKRIWGRYLKKGDAGLVHGLRGKPGPRAKATAVRRRILARFKERYADFGPTLAAEHLLKDGLTVDHETLRRWLIKAVLAAGPAAPQASGLAGAAGMFWPDGAVGWLGARLV
jgi:molybdenum-dependent DNA-binding transcriptional regulator ModE